MHVTVDRASFEDSDSAAFYPELRAVPRRIVAPSLPERSGFADRRAPNWLAIGLIAALHFVVLFALVKMDVISIEKKKAPPLVVDLMIEPPAPPPVQPDPQPVAKIVPQVVAPQAIVQTMAPPPPPISVTTTPPPPKPAVTAAAPAPTGPVSVDNLQTNLIDYKMPRYPTESRRRKEEGVVRLLIVIGTDGRVSQISVAQSSGFGRLDDAALDAVRKWRWTPLVRGGQAVEVQGRIALPFHLSA